MSVDITLPHRASVNDASLLLSFVVPAPGGCDLSCSYCFIAQRREANQRGRLAPADYAHFIEAACRREPVAAIAIQGYEALLPEAFPFTRAILETGRRFGVPTSLVTNGTHLAHWVGELAALAPTKIAVSLDAADPMVHDRQRGRVGAWAATVAGLRQAGADLPASTELVVTSVLMPKRRARLMAMPTLLRDLGIARWVIGALIKVGRDKAGHAQGDRAAILADLVALKRAAYSAGIDVVVDDQLGALGAAETDGKVVDLNALRIRRLAEPQNLLRLLPTGQCSIGQDILMQVRPDAPRWEPTKAHAGDFLDDLRHRPRCA